VTTRSAPSRWLLVLGGLTGVTPSLAGAQRTGPEPHGWAAYTRAFDAYADSDQVVGSAVVVVRDGRIVAHHEHGWQDRAAGERVSERTIFHWGSITKTLTAIAVLQLRDRGLLALDDPVTRWVPELRRVHDPFGSVDTITIAMLLSHAAGFQNPTWPYKQGLPWEPFEPTTWEQLVAMMPYQELLFPPGSRYSYSNPGFIYLARIIESITNDPWEVYVQKNLLTPLGLTHSYFGTTPYHLAPDRSNNYTVMPDSAGHDSVVANGRDFDPGITIPNGGWNAPLSDLATYAAFLTGARPGDTATERRYDMVLPRAILAEMWRPRYVTAAVGARDSTEHVALSFFTRERGGTTFVVIAAFNTRNDAHPDASSAGFAAIRDAALDVIRGGDR
jgi:CubicO group peptidase (beta-lactamase class C family)